MSAPVASLRDDFLDGLIASAWVAATTGSATAAETGGQARFTLPSSTAGTHTARYTSRVPYDFTGDWFPINIGTMVATGGTATAFFQHYRDGANALQWVQLSGTIFARTIIGGVSTDRFSAAWSGTTYKYLAISESAGTITWWSSTNGTTWTSRATLAAPFAVTDLFIDFGATCGNVASPGSFRIEDVNLILPALTTTWRWTQARRALVNRNRVTTLACDTVNTVQGYLVTADGVDSSDAPSGNVRYWSGPMDAGRSLTEQPTEAAAQAMAVNLPLDGRFDLPDMIDMRVVRLGHRSIDGASYILREFYPRRLIQADDIEAEIIRGMTISGHQFIADTLSALTANIGQLIIDPGGYLWQGTGTAAVPITGLKIFEVAGVGKLSTYNTGVEQVTLDTDGRLKAGAGAVVLDSTGISFDYSHASLPSYAYLQWKTGAGIIEADLGSQSLVGFTTLDLATYNSAGTVALTQLRFRGDRTTPANSFIDLIVNGTSPVTFDRLGVNANLLNVGTIGASGTGQLFTSGVIAIRGAAININTAISAKGVGATNATAAVTITNSVAAISFQVLDDKTIRTGTGNRWDLQGIVTGTPGAATKRVRILVDGQVCNLLSN